MGSQPLAEKQRFNVTITRVESFCIEATCADSAVDAAFDLTTSDTRGTATGRRTRYGAKCLAHDWETIEHTVEEDYDPVSEANAT